MRRLRWAGVAIASALLVSGCMTPQQRAERMLANYGPACTALGYVQGTQPWADCVMAQYQEGQRRAAAVGAAGAAILGAQPQPRRQQVCYWSGPYWVCS